MPLGTEIKEVYNEVLDLNNRQAEYEGFMTSFIPYHDKGMGPESEDGETALMCDGSYYILNGDWMLTYSELAAFGGWDACFAFFCRKYPQFGSSWSDRP